MQERDDVDCVVVVDVSSNKIAVFCENGITKFTVCGLDKLCIRPNPCRSCRTRHRRSCHFLTIRVFEGDRFGIGRHGQSMADDQQEDSGEEDGDCHGFDSKRTKICREQKLISNRFPILLGHRSFVNGFMPQALVSMNQGGI
jgi:hypothetical protein